MPRSYDMDIAMGKVSSWSQQLGVAVGVLLTSVFVLILAWFIAWSQFVDYGGAGT